MKQLEGFSTTRHWLSPRQVVAVDCDPSVAALTLSHHWGGGATPEEFRDDLAAGAALRWAASPERDRWLGKARVAYNDHVDVDGFLAAYVALRPDDALEDREALLAAAAAGDFAEWTSDKAVQFALLGERIADPDFSDVARRAFGVARKDRTEALYDAVLEELPELLRDPSRREDLWRQRWDDLQAQLRLFDRGLTRVEERPPHLSVIHAPRVLDTRAVLAKAGGHRLLQCVAARGGWLYVFRWRPHLGYRVVERPLTHVYDTGRMADLLNQGWPVPEERWRSRGWWSRELWLSQRLDRKGPPRTPPEHAVPRFEEMLRRLDAAHPEPRVAYAEA